MVYIAGVVRKNLFNFIWKNKKDRIKGTTPYQALEKGGLKLSLKMQVWYNASPTIANSSIHIRGRETRQTGNPSDEFPVLVWIRDEKVIWLTDINSY